MITYIALMTDSKPKLKFEYMKSRLSLRLCTTLKKVREVTWF